MFIFTFMFLFQRYTRECFHALKLIKLIIFLILSISAVSLFPLSEILRFSFITSFSQPEHPSLVSLVLSYRSSHSLHHTGSHTATQLSSRPSGAPSPGSVSCSTLLSQLVYSHAQNPISVSIHQHWTHMHLNNLDNTSVYKIVQFNSI